MRPNGVRSMLYEIGSRSPLYHVANVVWKENISLSLDSHNRMTTPVRHHQYHIRFKSG